MIINGKHTGVIGDNLYTMTSAHKSTDGRVWPAGTDYRPWSVGHDPRLGRTVDRVLIDGEEVTFA